MKEQQRERYLELQTKISEARDLRTKGREMRNPEMIHDAESKLDFNYGAMSELKKWFGDFPQPK